MTWATRITILRLLLIPVFIGLLLYYGESVRKLAPNENWRFGAFIVFAVASISDALDGFLARHFNQQSQLGAMLDPLADKLLLVSALLILSLVNFGEKPPFPLWFPIMIIARDAMLLIGMGVFRFQRLSIEIKPHWTGKLVTVLTILAIGLTLLRGPYVLDLCFAAGFFTIISTFIYIREGIRVAEKSN